MKNINKSIISFIALAAMMGFFFAACGEKLESEKTVSGTIIANTEGKISFMYSRTLNSYPNNCTFTTNLPSPNDRFTITIASGESTGVKNIENLNAGQQVEWSAKVSGKPLNHGSGNFVHVVN